MYKSFIKSIGSTKNAGVGFLPVPPIPVPPPVPASGTFTSIVASTTFVQLLGVVEDVGVFELGDNVLINSLVYANVAGTITAIGAGSITTDITFTAIDTTGTIVQVL